MKFIYETIAFKNYGWAIILFTVFMKVILLPLSVKQTKSSVMMQKLTPQLNEIEKRYKNDKNKLAEEKMKFLKENNANPMAGCLPLLLQFPIMIALYGVISSPLKYMYGKSAQVLEYLQKFIVEVKGFANVGARGDINIINFFSQYIGDSPHMESVINEANAYVSAAGIQANGAAIQSSEIVNMKVLFGLIDLGKIPSYSGTNLFGSEWKIYVPLLIIPILAALTSYIAGKYAAGGFNKDKNKKDNKKAEKPASPTPGGMTFLMPAMSVFISFTVPAGLGFYWAVSNVTAILQQWYITRLVNKEMATTPANAIKREYGEVIEGTVVKKEDNESGGRKKK